MNKIVYCQCTHDEQLSWTKKCIEKVKPYVDRVVIIFDDTVSFGFSQWLRGTGCEGYHYPFNDDFSENRNHYLSRVEAGDWALCSDPDEIFSDDALNNLRRLVDESQDGGKYNMVRFNGELVILNPDGSENHQPSDWYKFLLFKKYNDTVHYKGILHETIVGVWKEINVPYKYFHYKTLEDDIERSARNFFVVGGGANDQSTFWKEWREWLTKDFGINTWQQMKTLFRQGNIPQPLKDWIISIKDKRDYVEPVDSELRKFYNWYFEILHPEEIDK